MPGSGIRDAGSDQIGTHSNVWPDSGNSDPGYRIPDPDSENPVDPPSPDRRCGFYDAAHQGVEAHVSRRAPDVSGRTAGASGGSGESASGGSHRRAAPIRPGPNR